MSTIHHQTTVHAALDMPAVLRRGIWALVPTLGVLAGCQTTQGLPTVDDAQRRPINSAAAIELQSCKAEASALRATLLETVAPQCPRVEGAVKLAAALPALSAAAPTPAGSASRVAVFVFDQGQVSLSLDAATRETLKEAAAAAEIIQVRGRSGAAQESPADVLAARRRAEAAVAVLKDLGVPAHKLRVSWQGMSDPASEAGRNRRVEIEFVDRAPTVLFTRAAVDKSSTVATASTSAAGSAVAAAGTVAAKP